MIENFSSKLAKDIFDGTNSKHSRKLTGNLSKFWRIKLDKQLAIIFKWNNGIAFDVDIVDYHY